MKHGWEFWDLQSTCSSRPSTSVSPDCNRDVTPGPMLSLYTRERLRAKMFAMRLGSGNCGRYGLNLKQCATGNMLDETATQGTAI